MQGLQIKARVMQVVPGPSPRGRKDQKDNTTVAEPPSKKSTFLIVYQDKAPPSKETVSFYNGAHLHCQGMGRFAILRGERIRT